MSGWLKFCHYLLLMKYVDAKLVLSNLLNKKLAAYKRLLKILISHRLRRQFIEASSCR